MSELVKMIICPNPEHEDTDPSCGLYSDGSAWCFSCHTYFRGVGEIKPPKEKAVEDVKAKIEYIRGLPVISHRGLHFHSDDAGYYIIWPNGTYYKRRNWLSDSARSRYYSPFGHTKPIFWVTREAHATLIMVEGEINALSIKEAGIVADIVSPGSASDFSNNYMRSNLTLLRGYSNLLVLADADESGLKAILKFKSLSLGLGPETTINLMEEDCNKILVKYGKERLKEEIRKLGMR